MKAKKFLLPLAFLLVTVVVMAALGFGEYLSQAGRQTRTFAQKDLPPKWDKETVDLFKGMTVQAGGRFMPLETWAGIRMLQYRGKRVIRLPLSEADPDGKKTRTLGPGEWLLDSMFYPEKAENYPLFQVNDSEAITAIGVKAHDRRKSVYSLAELKPGRQKLMELSKEYGQIEAKARSVVQSQIVDLAGNVQDFEIFISTYVIMLREGFSTENIEQAPVFDVPAPLASAIGLPAPTRAGYSLEELRPAAAQIDAMRKRLEEQPGEKLPVTQLIVDLSNDIQGLESAVKSGWFAQAGKDGLLKYSAVLEGAGSNGPMPEVISRLVERRASSYQQMVTQYRQNIFMPVPPTDDSKMWETPQEQVAIALTKPEAKAAALAAVKQWEELATIRDDRPAFKEKLKAIASSAKEKAASRMEGSQVATELKYNGWNLFYRSIYVYLLGFLGISIAWMNFSSRWGKALTKASTWGAWLGVIMVVVGITLRCLIMRRPPITNLFETIPFITVTAVICCLLLERFNRRGIFLGLANFLGCVGMLAAFTHEVNDGADNLAPLQAVLATNFWLSTHVPAVNIGYAAGLLASAISCVYVVVRLFDAERKNDPELLTLLTKAMYGVQCFGLIFALVGTIAGGLWANYSWGRFWGWDPKENGALMIVLWMLIILHARLGGYLKEYGLHLASIFGGNVVAFSWWHVNLLGIGLHTYGFSAAIKSVVIWSYIILGVFLVLGFVGRWNANRLARRKKDSNETPLGASLAAGG